MKDDLAVGCLDLPITHWKLPLTKLAHREPRTKQEQSHYPCVQHIKAAASKPRPSVPGESIRARTPSNYAAISTIYEILVLSGLARHTGVVPNNEHTIATMRE